MRPAQIIDHRSLALVAEGQALDDVRPARLFRGMSKGIHLDEARLEKEKLRPRPVHSIGWADLLSKIPCALDRKGPAV